MTYDLDHFLSLRRVGSLVVSPSGDEAVVSVSEVAPEGTKMRTSLWAIDPAGADEPRRLTTSAAGESSPAYLPDGSLLFISARPDPDAAKPDRDDEPSQLWRLPADRGEAHLVASIPGTIRGLAVARDAGHVVLSVDVFPSADDLEADAELAKARREAKVRAQLFEHLPMRSWDRYLGPRQPRFFLLEPSADEPAGFAAPRQIAVGDPLQPETSFDITPDGATLVIERGRNAGPRDISTELVAIDIADGDERVLTSDEARYGGVRVDRAGRTLLCVRMEIPDDDTYHQSIRVIDLDTGDGRDVTPGFDLLPGEATWARDDRSIAFVADERGHRPVYVVDADGAEPPRRITTDGGFSAVEAGATGDGLVALRSDVGSAPRPVGVDEHTGELTSIPTPGSTIEPPGTFVDVEAIADDGTVIRSWLVLPDGADADEPAPLVVWVHGGPVASWNDWSWRWNCWLLVERGYAVLMPDPALSTGYGRDFIRRGYRTWGARPYTDVMTAVDGAVARPDIDADRTALMGGSFAM